MALTERQRHQLVYRLLYGCDLLTIRGITYKLVNPSPEIKFLAEEIYTQTVKKNRFGPWLTDRQCVAILAKNGLCSINIDANLKEISDRIDDLKVELYNSMFKKTIFKRVRKTLDSVKKKYDEMLNVRHMLDYLTLDGYAEMVKRQFIVCKTLYYADSNKLVWENENSIDYGILELIMQKSVTNIIKPEQLRELARTEPWKSIWSTSKGRPFDVPNSYLSEAQRSIMMFSQMYDSIAKHPDCPPNDVLEDDDLLDGWLIQENRKKEKEQLTKQFDERLGKHGDSDEVYVVLQGDTQEEKKAELERINALNDSRAKIIKAQRKSQLKQKGKVVDAEFLDRRMELQQMANQQFVQQVKGKK